MDAIRTDVPRYTVREASTYIGRSYGTFSKWVHGYRFVPSGRDVLAEGKPVIHTVETAKRGPRLAFAGLVEGLVIHALREAGVSFQAVRRIASTLRNEFGDEWALASRRLTLSGGHGPSGPEVLWNYAEKHSDEEVLVALSTSQGVFAPVVNDYLERIVYLDEYAGRVFLPLTDARIILVDPYRNFGQPIFASTAAPVDVVLGRLQAGEPAAAVARDFGLDADEIDIALRHASPLAA